MTPEELRAMDAEIHMKVMGQECRSQGGEWWEIVGICRDMTGALLPTMIPNYSTDIAAAWQVFEEMARRTEREPWCSENTYIDTGEKEWHVVFGGRFEAVEATAPLAICRAALEMVSDR